MKKTNRYLASVMTEKSYPHYLFIDKEYIGTSFKDVENQIYNSVNHDKNNYIVTIEITIKSIIRHWRYDYEEEKNADLRDGEFVRAGKWADGHISYSRLDENGEVLESDAGAFVQVRENGRLIMIRL